MSTRQLSDSAQLSRAARHLIQSHGSRAAAIAMKRAVYLHQCGEDAAADTWRKIGDLVQVIEAGKGLSSDPRGTNVLPSAMSTSPRPFGGTAD